MTHPNAQGTIRPESMPDADELAQTELLNEITTELGFLAAVTDAMAVVAVNRAFDQLRDDSATKVLLGVTEGLRRLTGKANDLEVAPTGRAAAS